MNSHEFLFRNAASSRSPYSLVPDRTNYPEEVGGLVAHGTALCPCTIVQHGWPSPASYLKQHFTLLSKHLCIDLT